MFVRVCLYIFGQEDEHGIETLRFSCGTNSRGNCTAVLQRTNNVSYEIIKCYNANV